jgi:membrane protein required for colicin V production
VNWLDLGVIGIIVLSAVFAFARGFVREALSIVAWVGAAAITLYGFNWAYAQIDPHIKNPLLSQIVAGLGLFVASLVVLTILTGFLARMVHASGLTPIDRTLGFIFGLARGALLVCLAYLLLELMVPQQSDRPPWMHDAKSLPYLHEGADVLKGFLPESIKIKSADDAIKALAPPIEAKPTAAEEAESAKRALAKPTPAAPAKPETATAPSYPQRERQQLDRVIQNQR